MYMDEESQLTLKLLSEGRISARSADRILHALIASKKNTERKEGDSLISSAAQSSGTPEDDSPSSHPVSPVHIQPITLTECIEGSAQEDKIDYAECIQEAGGELAEQNVWKTEGNREIAVAHGECIDAQNRSYPSKSTVNLYQSEQPLSLRALSLIIIGFVFMIFIATYAVLNYRHSSVVRKMQNEFSINTLEQSFRIKSLEKEMQKYQSAIANLSKKTKRKSLGLFDVTAYDPVESCKPFDDGITSVGLPAGMGIAAVDPKVIPYGSILYIPDLNKYFFACDTGSAMKRGNGKNIDILMPTVREALRFGRKSLRVELIDLVSG